jgi:HEAT repeat protein
VLRYDDQLLRGLCLITLGRIGHPDAVPAILEVLSDPPVRNQASETLSAVRDEAVHALGAIGPAAGAATPILSGMLGEPNLFAVEALARIGRNAHSAVPSLLQLLRGDDRSAAVAAAAALRSICDETRESSQVLQRVMTDQDADVATRLKACALLLDCDTFNAGMVVPTLLELADKSNFAIELLGRCGRGAEEAIPWLEVAMRTPPRGSGALAAATIG